MFARTCFEGPHAQTATYTGILVQGRYCLDLAGNYSEANPPPQGTRVVAQLCSGRPSQRWMQAYGEYNDLLAIGNNDIVLGFRTSRGVTLNVGGR